MAGMPQIPRHGAKLKTALAVASLLGLVVIGWAGVHVVAGRSGPRMINVGSSEDAAGSVAVSPGGKTLFAASGDCCGAADTVTEVDLATGRAGRRIVVGGPVLRLTVTPDGKTLFTLIAKSTTTSAVTPVNLATGRAAKPLRLHVPLDMVASPDSALLYVLDDTGGKSLAVVPVSVASGRAGRPIPVLAGSQALAISSDGETLYVGAGNPHNRWAGEVIAIDARSGKARAPIPVPRNVWDLATSPGGSRLYVLASNTHCGAQCTLGPCELVTINTAKATAARPLALNPRCYKLAAAPNGKFAYVLNGDQTITPVETGYGFTGPPIRTGHFGEDFALTPDGSMIYVAERAQGVAVIPVPRCQASTGSTGCPDE
jgi:DNA-binding beta-propeller fold protein YncE